MSNTQSRPQTNSQDEFGNGIWRLWPFSVISRSLQKSQQSLEMRLRQLNEQQESLAIREEALSVALKKAEQISLRHQQNNIIEIDRLEQEIERLTSTLDNPKKLPSPQYPIPANKGVVNELTSQSGAPEDGYLFESALNSMHKDIRALQVYARAQAMRVSALATLAGETLPNFADENLASAQPLAEDLKRLSTRERNIALQLKQLSNAAQ
jgi:hypothetical protein